MLLFATAKLNCEGHHPRESHWPRHMIALLMSLSVLLELPEVTINDLVVISCVGAGK